MPRPPRPLVALVACAALANAPAAQGPAPKRAMRKPSIDDTIRANVYADNWFMLYVNGELVIVENSEDSERGRIFATSTALTTMGFVVALAVSGAVGEVLTPRQGVFLGSTLCLVALAVNGARVMREVNRKRLGVA